MVISCLLFFSLSELYVELYSDSPFVNAREVGVCKSPYIIYPEHLEDILDSYSQFHVRHSPEVVVFIVLVRELV